eukprot:TRINITY_DN46649_c0_g1_i1.p1 TRINITY_DN46649_c0_g1~~TRINITY_DN46649_c0_g1_i1.p1  ORF type:complete len:246 (+),score=13.03 TRINITY_DN46649_c0_g1_i1:252-989(+)
MSRRPSPASTRIPVAGDNHACPSSRGASPAGIHGVGRADSIGSSLSRGGSHAGISGVGALDADGSPFSQRNSSRGRVSSCSSGGLLSPSGRKSDPEQLMENRSTRGCHSLTPTNGRQLRSFGNESVASKSSNGLGAFSSTVTSRMDATEGPWALSSRSRMGWSWSLQTFDAPLPSPHSVPPNYLVKREMNRTFNGGQDVPPLRGRPDQDIDRRHFKRHNLREDRMGYESLRTPYIYMRNTVEVKE